MNKSNHKDSGRPPPVGMLPKTAPRFGEQQKPRFYH